MNYDALLPALKLMAQGMIAVFIVMSTISMIVYLFTRFLNGKNND